MHAQYVHTHNEHVYEGVCVCARTGHVCEHVFLRVCVHTRVLCVCECVCMCVCVPVGGV